MTNAVKDNSDFRDAVDAALVKLMHRDFCNDRATISLPTFYSNGSSAVVEVYRDGHGFWVTDAGFAYQEVDNIGANDFFTRGANKIAEDRKVSISQHVFSLSGVGEAQLSGAIITVAECSQLAFNLAAEKLANKRYSETHDELYVRLVDVFKKDNVTANAPFEGASGHTWEIDAVVRHAGGIALFEHVRSTNQASYTPVVAKYHDIARREEHPARISVVPSKEQMGDIVALLSQASNVIEMSVPNATFLRSVELTMAAR